VEEKYLRSLISSYTNIFYYFAMIGQRIVRTANSNALS